jgi:hypothetical protein
VATGRTGGERQGLVAKGRDWWRKAGTGGERLEWWIKPGFVALGKTGCTVCKVSDSLASSFGSSIPPWTRMCASALLSSQ